MSADQAYDLLGVREGAGFDDILTAKNRLTKANEHDQDKIVRVSVLRTFITSGRSLWQVLSHCAIYRLMSSPTECNAI